MCDRQSLHMTASFLCVEYIPLTKQVQGLHCKLWTAFFPTSMAQVQSTSAMNLRKCKKQGAVTYSMDWKNKVNKMLRRNPIEDGAISGFSGQKSVPE